MKKSVSIITLLAVVVLSFTSCLSTGVASQYNTVDVPVDPEEAAHAVVAYEKSGDYLYSFKAVNYGNAECNVKIYDDKYMKVTYPQTGTSFFYYYKFYGDYLEYSERKGIFGYTVSLTTGEVEEIVFRKMFFGGYKFRSIADQQTNDKRYAEGYITWNTYPAARQPDNSHFLEFFLVRDKKLSSTTDEVGNKRDLAGTVYCAISEKPNWKAKWELKSDIPQNTTTSTTNEENNANGENE